VTTAELTGHLTGIHTMHPTTFGGLATHSRQWLQMLHDGLHDAENTPRHD
jgi:hypothetical protein